MGVEDSASPVGHVGLKTQLPSSGAAWEERTGLTPLYLYCGHYNQDSDRLPTYLTGLTELSLFKCLERPLPHSKCLVNVRLITNSFLKEELLLLHRANLLCVQMGFSYVTREDHRRECWNVNRICQQLYTRCYIYYIHIHLYTHIQIGMGLE